MQDYRTALRRRIAQGLFHGLEIVSWYGARYFVYATEPQQYSSPLDDLAKGGHHQQMGDLLSVTWHEGVNL